MCTVRGKQIDKTWLTIYSDPIRCFSFTAEYSLCFKPNVWWYQMLSLRLLGHKLLLTLAVDDPKWHWCLTELPDMFHFPRLALLQFGFVDLSKSISKHQLFCVGWSSIRELKGSRKSTAFYSLRICYVLKNKMWLLSTPLARETWRGRPRPPTSIKSALL